MSSSSARLSPPVLDRKPRPDVWVKDLALQYERFTQPFVECFQVGHHNHLSTAQQYLCGLMQADKANMERMSEAVPESDEQVLQHFLTDSPWEHRPVIDQVARNAEAMLGSQEDTGLYLDESAFAKKGEDSVGVARQWNGRLGKPDNCQVGVFGALGRAERVSLIDARLYLPKEWTDDPERCDKAEIPKGEQIPRTKLELALEIVRHARASGIRFAWVGVDALYGRSLPFLKTLQQDGEIFVADIDSDRHIYLTDPAAYLPAQKDGLGRKRKRFESDEKPIEVRKWVKKQPASAWRKKTLRDSTRGKLQIEVMHQRVWLWDKKSAQADCWHLIVRRELASPETLKYSLSNAPAQISLSKLAKMQGQRFWIERAFEDAKSHIGMAQYQARKWPSWHRHMALVMMAMQFMLQTRLKNQKAYPLLSCYDIQVLLATTLPDRRRSSPEEIVRQMQIRHQKRQASIDAANRKSLT